MIKHVPKASPIDHAPGWLIWVVFTVLGFVIYFPAIYGEFIWDDVSLYIVENPLLRDPNGLWKFWFTNEPIDYYPLTYSSFWVEWQIAGESTFLYHFNNTAIHIATSVGVYWMLRELKVPWALWISVIFLVHPIQVESVAWISQRKTILSVFFGVYAVWLYSLSQELRSRRLAIFSLTAFALSLAAKPTLITLPIAIGLVEIVKQRTTLLAVSLTMLPYFAISMVFGVVGLFYVDKLLGLVDVREQNLIERLLSMSWAFLFYFRQLFAVWTLNFVYPRWDISASSIVDWLPTAVVLIITGLLWTQRRRLGVEPFLAWSISWITLFPILGLVDVFFWRYSYVGDHYAYQSIPAMIAVFSYLLSHWIGRLKVGEQRILAYASIAILSVTSFLRSDVYKSQEAIWTDSIEKNPRAGLALNQLGVLLLSPELLLKCAEVQPQIYETWVNLAKLSLMQGDLSQAATYFENGEQVAPRLSTVHLECLVGRAICYAGLGRPELAKELVATIHQRELSRDLVDPIPAQCSLDLAVVEHCLDDPIANHLSAGERGRNIEFERLLANNSQRLAAISKVCEDCGRIDYALLAYQTQFARDPDDLVVIAAIGRCYFKLQKLDLALQFLEKAIGAGDNSLETEFNLGAVLMSLGRVQDGLAAFERASNKPESTVYFRLWSSLGLAYVVNGQPSNALEAWRRALQINPDDLPTLRDAAWLIATKEALSSQPSLLDFADDCATKCCQATDFRRLDCLDALAATKASRGDYSQAVKTIEPAIALAEKGNAPTAYIESLKLRLDLYKSSKPYRE